MGLPTALTSWPADLWIVVATALVATVVVLAAGPGAIRLAAGSLMLFVLPGYALVAALYPAGEGVSPGADTRRGVGLLERLALSFGVSLALVPLVTLATWPLTRYVGSTYPTAFRPLRLTVLPALTLIVIVGAVLAARRRSRLPSGHQFRLPFDRWLDAVRGAVGPSSSRANRLLSVALGVSILLAAASLGYGLAVPADGEQFTSAALLAPGEDGQPVASGYPQSMTAGEPVDLVLKLDNHEGQDVAYTTVIRAERLQTGDGEPTVTATEELDRLSVSVPAGEERLVDHTVATGMTGEDVRLTYYVYKGDAPESPSESSAYRMVYLRVTVGGS